MYLADYWVLYGKDIFVEMDVYGGKVMTVIVSLVERVVSLVLDLRWKGTLNTLSLV